MKNYCYSTLYILLLTIILTSCDSGDIIDVGYDQIGGGRIIKMNIKVCGVSEWDDQYQIALAGFKSDSKYAVAQRVIPHTTKDSTELTLILNASSDISTAELAITDKLRKRIITLKEIKIDDLENSQDTILFNVGLINVGRFGALQNGLFNNACIQCHGGNGSSAAGLTLTEDLSYKMLVNSPSSKISGEMRIKAGDVDKSLMRKILNTGGEELLHYNHTEILSSQFKWNLVEIKQLIDEWILSLNTDKE